MPSDSQIFVLWEVYIYRYTTNCKCLLIWILCTLSKRTIFIYIHVLVGFYMKTTHCFVNIFHVSYEWLNILRCVFTVLFSRPLLPKNERKKISATNSALLVYSFSRHECQCGCNKVCLWIKLLFVFTITGEDLRRKKEKKKTLNHVVWPVYRQLSFALFIFWIWNESLMPCEIWTYFMYNNDVTSKQLVSKTFNCCLFCYIIK